MYFTGRVLSQNFIRNKHLIKKIVSLAKLSSGMPVVDIGAGEGIITQELANSGYSVLAVESDSILAERLATRFKSHTAVSVYNADIRSFPLPSVPYSVFLNIPFHITSEVIYKLLYYSHPPEKAYLIMQKEAAEKFSGGDGSTQFSLLAGPWFEFRILYRFLRADFYPPPHVDVVLLEIVKRKIALLLPEDELLYKNFVTHLFGQWKRNMKLGTKKFFTYTQWKRLAHAYSFSLTATPTELTLAQWLGIFAFFKKLHQ